MVAGGNSIGGEDRETRQLGESRYRLRDLFLVAFLTAYSSITRWALVRTSDNPGSVSTGDPVGVLPDVEASGRFIRDSGLGRILHPGRGKISYRQAVRENSLHIIIDGNRVSAHIDRLSPLAFDEHGNPYYSLRRTVRYSLKRILTHNLASTADTVWTLVSRHWSAHRRTFYCERLDPEEAHRASHEGDPG